MGFIYAVVYDLVQLSYGPDSYQGGWHIVSLLIVLPFTYIAGGILGIIVYFIKKEGKEGLKWFAIGSQIFMAIPWLPIIFLSLI